ncbi:SAM-dependent methyltransferase [Candidatus Uabimicrobium amorphum]|uniref:Type 11 methyltransferase n=1 Tax=Uabimicrobium amorphum TaxID=2596890 RepID=A0A5S9IPT1_UABAM|nr:methyltransferase domain-containing protein [Candidatus Uabimicrobium amorphum]BBM85467.1 type 11 methyltransferase [Candidatus Uabimicrobium amorphum]
MSVKEDVAGYYDNNTSKFLRFGHGKHNFAIHRAVWFPGIENREQAILFHNQYIYDYIAAHKKNTMRVLDLGCGVGGSLFFLADLLPQIHFYGLTNSREQQQIATKLQERFATTNVEILCGDFHDIPSEIPQVDVIFAIESFVHSHSPPKLMQQVFSKLSEDGVCIVIDDFLVSAAAESHRCVDTFRRGWFAPGIMTVDDLCKQSEGFRMEKKVDLTSFLELRRVRDYAIACVSPLLKYVPGYYFNSLIGGNALRYGLLNNLIEYNVVVMKKMELSDSVLEH